jgi:hypothetical protein
MPATRERRQNAERMRLIAPTSCVYCHKPLNEESEYVCETLRSTIGTKTLSGSISFFYMCIPCSEARPC